MVEQDVPTDSVAASDFNIDGILKKILRIFNNPSAPVSIPLQQDLIALKILCVNCYFSLSFNQS